MSSNQKKKKKKKKTKSAFIFPFDSEKYKSICSGFFFFLFPLALPFEHRILYYIELNDRW